MVRSDSKSPARKPTRQTHQSLTETFPEVGRRIRVYKNGDVFDNGINFVLNMRQIHDIGTFLDLISERIGLVLGAKKLYTLNGKLIKKTSELENGHEYVASSGTFTKATYGARSLKREPSFGASSRSNKTFQSTRSRSSDVLNKSKKKEEPKQMKPIKSNEKSGTKGAVTARGVKRSKSTTPSIAKTDTPIEKIEKAPTETVKKVKKEAEIAKQAVAIPKEAATTNGIQKKGNSATIVKPVKAGVKPNKGLADAGKGKETVVKKALSKGKKANVAAAMAVGATAAATGAIVAANEAKSDEKPDTPNVEDSPKMEESEKTAAKDDEKSEKGESKPTTPKENEEHKSEATEVSHPETPESRSKSAKSESGNATDHTEESGVGTAETDHESTTEEESESSENSEEETDDGEEHSEAEESDEAPPPSRASRCKSSTKPIHDDKSDS